ncbi:MAG: PIG-L family deacetylase [Bryobacteraceae bacterium]|nr:PIG-L family deacetylase [Bryobacteraceae bacterium]
MFADLPGVLLGRRPEARVTIVAAHPDDESIGAASRLASLPGLTIIHVTDGSPRNLADAARNGFHDAAGYARQRRLELAAALSEARVSPQLVELGIQDQTAAENLTRLSHSLAGHFSRNRPDLILTHPYEGGHPDHDATAFAVSAAAELAGIPRSSLAEFTSYHVHKDRLRTGAFLPNGGPEIVCELTSGQQVAKRRVFDCFRTQLQILEPFVLTAERFRLSPPYDFNRPPHSGELWYERLGWEIDGARFRRLASRAAQELELGTLAAR